MHYRSNQKRDMSPYWWGAVFAAAALFLGLMVYTTGSSINTASVNNQPARAPGQVR